MHDDDEHDIAVGQFLSEKIFAFDFNLKSGNDVWHSITKKYETEIQPSKLKTWESKLKSPESKLKAHELK